VLWTALAVLALYDKMEPSWPVKAGLAVIAVYFLVAGLLPRSRNHT
jgi:hypothetical protein